MMQMHEKVALIGAGSVSFTRGLVGDMLRAGWQGELALVDIDPHALDVAAALVRKMVAAAGADVTVTGSVDRTDVLSDATVVITTIGVGGRRAWEQDVFVPRKFGIYQPVGDSVMPGGTSRALRMIPPMIDIARDVQRLAPQALFFNYGNPMAAVCRAVWKETGAPMVGLCHGVHDWAAFLARALGVERNELAYTAVGMNHLTWFTELMGVETSSPAAQGGRGLGERSKAAGAIAQTRSPATQGGGGLETGAAATQVGGGLQTGAAATQGGGGPVPGGLVPPEQKFERKAAEFSSSLFHDLLPRLKEYGREHGVQASELGARFAEAGTAGWSEHIDNPFCFQLLELFGAIPAPGDRHVCEFFPQMFKCESSYFGKTLGVDAYSFEQTIANGDRGFAEMETLALSDEPLPDDYLGKAGGEHEQVVDIVESIRSNACRVYSANLPNRGQVGNLPLDAPVEAPAVAGADGLKAVQQSALPAGVAGTLATRMQWVETVVEAAVERSRTKFVQTLVLDGAVGSLEQAEKLADELLAAQAGHLEWASET